MPISALPLILSQDFHEYIDNTCKVDWYYLPSTRSISFALLLLSSLPPYLPQRKELILNSETHFQYQPFLYALIHLPLPVPLHTSYLFFLPSLRLSPLQPCSFCLYLSLPFNSLPSSTFTFCIPSSSYPCPSSFCLMPSHFPSLGYNVLALLDRNVAPFSAVFTYFQTGRKTPDFFFFPSVGEVWHLSRKWLSTHGCIQLFDESVWD